MNQLSSVPLVVDVQDGTIAQRIDYDEFGRVLFESAKGLQSFGFAGGLYDLDTGLVRFGAREYDAETGRWTATDPILFAGGDTNLHAYVGNDPVNLIDPAGLEGFNVATDSALNGGLLSWLGFGTVAQGLMDRADGMLAMRNAATFERGLSKYRGAICQIGAGYMQAAGTMTAIAGAVTIGVALARGAITITARGLNHMRARHVAGGARTAGKSLFFDGPQQEVQALIQAAGRVAPTAQQGGNFQRIVDAGRPIGIDRATGQPTSVYTVITNAAGELVTAFPGTP
jgi:RHS repeat-associated protein